MVRGLEGEERCALLKFVTSCSRAPLLGFKHLQPAFTIHKVKLPESHITIFADLSSGLVVLVSGLLCPLKTLNYYI